MCMIYEWWSLLLLKLIFCMFLFFGNFFSKKIKTFLFECVCANLFSLNLKVRIVNDRLRGSSTKTFNHSY